MLYARRPEGGPHQPPGGSPHLRFASNSLQEGGKYGGGWTQPSLPRYHLCHPGWRLPPDRHRSQHFGGGPVAVPYIGRSGASFQEDAQLAIVHVHRRQERVLRDACVHSPHPVYGVGSRPSLSRVLSAPPAPLPMSLRSDSDYACPPRA